jgi:hypothetical protein
VGLPTVWHDLTLLCLVSWTNRVRHARIFLHLNVFFAISLYHKNLSIHLCICYSIIIYETAMMESGIHTGGWKGYHGVVDLGSTNFRVHHGQYEVVCGKLYIF